MPDKLFMPTHPSSLFSHAHTRTHHQPDSSPGLAQWACYIKASAYGSRVGWTPARRIHSVRTEAATSVRLAIIRHDLLPGSRRLHSVNDLEVFLQVRRLAEDVRTHRTLVRLGSGVDYAVSGKTSGTREPLLADSALIRLGSGVHARVTVQLSRPTKGASTHRAFVRLLAGMAAEVYDEFAGRREALPAYRALESLLTAVELHVNAQVLRASKRLPARRALERFLAGVDPRVSCKLTHPCKPLAADRALVRAFAGVRAAVYRQRALALKAVATLATHVLALLTAAVRCVTVFLLVPHQPLLRHEPLVAPRTRERTLTRVRSHMHLQVSFV